MDKPLIYFRVVGHVLHHEVPCEELEILLKQAIEEKFKDKEGVTAEVYVIGHPYQCPCADRDNYIAEPPC